MQTRRVSKIALPMWSSQFKKQAAYSKNNSTPLPCNGLSHSNSIPNTNVSSLLKSAGTATESNFLCNPLLLCVASHSSGSKTSWKHHRQVQWGSTLKYKVQSFVFMPQIQSSSCLTTLGTLPQGSSPPGHGSKWTRLNGRKFLTPMSPAWWRQKTSDEFNEPDNTVLNALQRFVTPVTPAWWRQKSSDESNEPSNTVSLTNALQRFLTLVTPAW